MDHRFERERFGTGIREWAEISFNIQRGCSNGCLYCYAKDKAIRYRTIFKHTDWASETIMQSAVNRKWFRNKGVIMFPTAHDITLDNIHICKNALINVLSEDNCVLIVSKPRLECIQLLCKDLEQYKEQILFRFTIGSISEEVCHFWEPGAPSPKERIESLIYAYNNGYNTSVSIEPMLEGRDMAVETFNRVKHYVTDTVWIGKMRKIRLRVDISNKNNLAAVENIEALQRDGEVMRLVQELKDEDKVRWKDSIREVIKRHSK